MVRVWQWWRELNAAQRMDVATRWPLYLASASEPLLALLVAVGQPDRRDLAAGCFVLVSALHAAVCVALLRAGLAAYLGDLAAGPSRRLVGLAGGLAVAAVAVAAGAFPAVTKPTDEQAAVGLAVVLLVGGAFTVALAPMLRAPVLGGLVLLEALAVVGLSAATGVGGQLARSGLSLTEVAAFYTYPVLLAAFTYRVSVWMVGVVWEIDRSRALHARLAVAEERLRFARDLHDVLGRNLSLVAVQSELAARLAARGDGQAAERMLEVRQVAHESLRELRAVVGGYRATDLDAELAGARSVLRSAGVSCEVTGDGSVLPAAVHTALGWLVREATTNVIRHSDATVCTIELRVSGGQGDEPAAVLRMENDGVRPAGSVAGGGTGLTGLGERLAEVGGTLTVAEPRAGRFVVEARVPAGLGPNPNPNPNRVVRPAAENTR